MKNFWGYYTQGTVNGAKFENHNKSVFFFFFSAIVEFVWEPAISNNVI